MILCYVDEIKQTPPKVVECLDEIMSRKERKDAVQRLDIPTTGREAEEVGISIFYQP